MEKGYVVFARANQSRVQRLLIPLLLLIALLSLGIFKLPHHSPPASYEPAILKHCRSLKQAPGPPPNFHKRKQSDRFASGTKPTLIKNAKIWTGRNNGTHILHGDILLDKGLIMGVGHFGTASYGNDLTVINAGGRWVSPGIVDIHSHLGDAPSPALDGAEDDNSIKGTILPWMRSLDGLNTHDDSYALSISGGVTTSLVLPGSADAIGGQAYVIKLRKTTERSPSSMLLEPPYQINASDPWDSSIPPRWRHMKHACGENPSSVYSATRMDTMWAFRQAYNKAKHIMKQQDEYCSKAETGNIRDLGDFPEDLQWESLVDVLRGKVKVNIHCYEAVDLGGVVRLSNEFQFPIAAFHHASETYLTPELLKRAYGKPPAIALFATNARYKRESYRGSEFAPRILAENGFTVLMKSDHPVLDSRHLLYEAQQAYYYGLPENLALAAITSNSAEIMGMGHRIGYIKKGWDADLVIWDSHPLALGATPVQVFIDGIPQLQSPYVSDKPPTFQKSPKVPNFDKEAQLTLDYDGLPPLNPVKAAKLMIFTNVSNVFVRSSGTVKSIYSTTARVGGVVVSRNGRLLCTGNQSACLTDAVLGSEVDYQLVVDLKGGSIEPALTSYGAPLGLEHINQEPSTNDGFVFEPLSQHIPKILGGSIVRAVDGLLFDTRDSLYAYRAGVTTGITAPSHYGFFFGLGTAFSTGASHRLESGSVLQEVTALHTAIGFDDTPSVSTQIATLRKLLITPPQGSAGIWFKKVSEGSLTLVVETHSADVIATLLVLKAEIETAKGTTIKLTISGANEAHLLAEYLGEANVGVLVYPRPFPTTWDRRRIAPGPPLSLNAVQQLIAHNVTVGLMIAEVWEARNLPFDVAWTSLDVNGTLGKEEAIALGSVNVEKLLGVKVEAQDADLVARGYSGDSLFPGKVVGVLSPRKGVVEFF
ncbi:carbohydrate esterase family 9 protein [Lentinula aciculospora]|uniref:Carbohydrate esterase family 9 protein n=1 Tax=Lentinula aciculospora TaxID=153920 RepID=A0A9W9AJN0_9AGAR|nr:carbohydrate esterase family 9 protein [Lentinula aciculospora]